MNIYLRRNNGYFHEVSSFKLTNGKLTVGDSIHVKEIETTGAANTQSVPVTVAAGNTLVKFNEKAIDGALGFTLLATTA